MIKQLPEAAAPLVFASGTAHSASRECYLSHPEVSGPLGTMPVGLMAA